MPRKKAQKFSEPQTDEELDALGREWLGILRLSDWDVRFQFVLRSEMSEPLQLGECCYDELLKIADIKILHPLEYDPSGHTAPRPRDLERDLVHELLHLMFFALTPADDTSLTYKMFEQSIELTAGALVVAKRGR